MARSPCLRPLFACAFLPVYWLDPSILRPFHAEVVPKEVDSDQDGISDAAEVELTGTNPYAADTDSDGVIDSREDQNQDGMVGPGESDPNTPGLFPGSYPHIPEPMVFDLVRALGAIKGELETNVLAVGPIRRGAGITWAPEIEWAFASGHAVEFELPMHNGTIEALKLALQGTLPERLRPFIHGWQIIGERALTSPLTELTALYLMGARIDPRLSVMAMAGGRAHLSPEGDRSRHASALLNTNVFGDLRETLTLGLESNLRFDLRRLEWTLVPQVHWQVSRHLRVQMGAGAARREGGAYPLLAFRMVVE